MIQCKMMCRKHMFLLTTVAQKAASRGLHVPGGAVELGGPTTSRAQMSKGLSLFLLVYLSDFASFIGFMEESLLKFFYLDPDFWQIWQSAVDQCHGVVGLPNPTLGTHRSSHDLALTTRSRNGIIQSLHAL